CQRGCGEKEPCCTAGGTLQRRNLLFMASPIPPQAPFTCGFSTPLYGQPQPGFGYRCEMES
uniref:Uncharacterized protein n=1 Tax=Moschus moschiferus TaxID=68415 RepID=A0A8C6E1J4_MOSMO